MSVDRGNSPLTRPLATCDVITLFVTPGKAHPSASHIAEKMRRTNLGRRGVETRPESETFRVNSTQILEHRRNEIRDGKEYTYGAVSN